MANQLKSASTQVQQPSPRRNDDKLLQQLRKLWSSHQSRGLKVRHAMGVSLNKRLGDPAKRLSRGEGLVDKVSAELGIDKSDISRFRRFAARYENLQAFCEEHPDVRSWTAARELIAKPRRRVTGKRTVAGVLRSLQTTTASLRRVVLEEGPEVDQIRSALQELVKVATSRLGIVFDEMNGMDNADSLVAEAPAEAA